MGNNDKSDIFCPLRPSKLRSKFLEITCHVLPSQHQRNKGSIPISPLNCYTFLLLLFLFSTSDPYILYTRKMARFLIWWSRKELPNYIPPILNPQPWPAAAHYTVFQSPYTPKESVMVGYEKDCQYSMEHYTSIVQNFQFVIWAVLVNSSMFAHGFAVSLLWYIEGDLRIRLKGVFLFHCFFLEASLMFGWTFWSNELSVM